MAQNELKLKIDVTIFCTHTISKRAHFPTLKQSWNISLKIGQVWDLKSPTNLYLSAMWQHCIAAKGGRQQEGDGCLLGWASEVG
jgi:hypothetical protein